MKSRKILKALIDYLHSLLSTMMPPKSNWLCCVEKISFVVLPSFAYSHLLAADHHEIFFSRRYFRNHRCFFWKRNQGAPEAIP